MRHSGHLECSIVSSLYANKVFLVATVNDLAISLYFPLVTLSKEVIYYQSVFSLIFQRAFPFDTLKPYSELISLLLCLFLDSKSKEKSPTLSLVNIKYDVHVVGKLVR